MKNYIFLLLIIFTACNVNDKYKNDIEEKFMKAGLIKISDYDKTIKVDLVNSDSNKNFFRENYYNGLKSAYMQKSVALKLVKAQKILKKKNRNYSILIMDAARPQSVSFKMYNKLKNTSFKRYVANPKTGSMHNYGAAVDVTIIDQNGNHLDMGINPFYKNSIEISYMFAQMKFNKKLTIVQKRNRDLLKNVMEKAGFRGIKLEWWHFNGYSKSYIRKKYKIIR